MHFFALNGTDRAVKITPNPGNSTVVILEGANAKAAFDALGGWEGSGKSAPYTIMSTEVLLQGQRTTVGYKRHFYNQVQLDEYIAEGGNPWEWLLIEVQMCQAPAERVANPDDDNEY
jgi:hypothetical protein